MSKISYEDDIKKFTDSEKSLIKISKDFIKNYELKTRAKNECIICDRYANDDPNGVLVHLVKTHHEILKLIKETRV